MTPDQMTHDRAAYLEVFLRLFDALGKQVFASLPNREESKDYREAWVDWALKGRGSARLRGGIRDALEMVPHLPGAWRAQLFAEIRAATGVDLNEFRAAHLKRVAAILERGRVRSLSEFAVLRSHVDELEGDPAREPELSTAYRLLDEFEARSEKRREAS